MKIYQLLKKELGNKLFLLILLSLISGVCNMLLLKIISDFLSGSLVTSNTALFYLSILVVFFFISRYLGLNMLKVGLKSMALIRKVLIGNVAVSSYTHFQRTGKEKILSSLTSDTETLSDAPENLIIVLTNIATIIICFIYLAYLSISLFLILMLISGIVIGIYNALIRGMSEKYRLARNTEDNFFKYVGDLLNGFRELRINTKKRDDFLETDLLQTVEKSYSLRLNAGTRFVNVNTILYCIVYLFLGFFIFFLFQNKTEIMITYIVILIYLIGPLRLTLESYQSLIQINIAASKIMSLLTDLKIDINKTDIGVFKEKNNEITPPTFNSIEFKSVIFEYHQEEEPFHVGPVDLTIWKGETIFISGGNGSGKTTFIQLLLGLYVPKSGKVTLNNELDIQKLLPAYMNLFSVIHADYHLFSKLYGLDRTVSDEEANYYINKVDLQNKINIHENQYGTTDLSQGQRKRLALLTSYFEDKEIIIFDEFAADQDPKFRAYFYTTIIPDLISAGKTVIAITHDDKYYDYCDRMIKFDFGEIIELLDHNQYEKNI